MKIIKGPVFEEATCPACGSVFQPEAGDKITFLHNPFEESHDLLAAKINCPVCGNRLQIFIKETQDEL